MLLEASRTEHNSLWIWLVGTCFWNSAQVRCLSRSMSSWSFSSWCPPYMLDTNMIIRESLECCMIQLNTNLVYIISTLGDLLYCDFFFFLRAYEEIFNPFFLFWLFHLDLLHGYYSCYSNTFSYYYANYFMHHFMGIIDVHYSYWQFFPLPFCIEKMFAALVWCAGYWSITFNAWKSKIFTYILWIILWLKIRKCSRLFQIRARWFWIFVKSKFYYRSIFFLVMK